MDWIWLLTFFATACECDMPILEAVWFCCEKEAALFKEIVLSLEEQLVGEKLYRSHKNSETINYVDPLRNWDLDDDPYKYLLIKLKEYIIFGRPDGDSKATKFWFKWQQGKPHFFVDYPPGSFQLSHGDKIFVVTRKSLSFLLPFKNCF